MRLSILFLLFVIYSFTGWFFETIETFIKQGKFVNRGFLIGPYCPIYGIGGILMVLLLNRYISDAPTLFIMCTLLFSTLEYITSFLMEKLFNARWWDYSKFKFNINGRVCLEMMIPFGMVGVLFMYVINPFFMNILYSIPNTILTLLSIILLIILVVDISFSTKAMVHIKGTINKVKLDNTEEITEKIKELLLQKGFIKKRIIKAFPKFKIR